MYGFAKNVDVRTSYKQRMCAVLLYDPDMLQL
jgi:hypothetical protein